MPGSLPVRFPGPPAEPAVRIFAQRALHGICHQAWPGIQGLGMRLPRHRYRVTGTPAMLNGSIPFTAIDRHPMCTAPFIT